MGCPWNVIHNQVIDFCVWRVWIAQNWSHNIDINIARMIILLFLYGGQILPEFFSGVHCLQVCGIVVRRRCCIARPQQPHAVIYNVFLAR